MNKILCLLFLLLISFTSFTQKNKSQQLGFILLDANGNNVKSLDKAAVYLVVTKANDTTFVVRTYKNNGALKSQETFLDKDLTIPNGRFAYYDKDGNIDSTGIAIRGHKHGMWMTFAHITRSYNFVDDSVINVTYYNLGKEISREEYFHDTTENSAIKRTFFKAGLPISETQFNKDTTGQREAKYLGGEKEWENYLRNNMNAQVAQLIPQYSNLNDLSVVVSFLVGRDSSTDDIFIMNSCGYPFDTEAMRVIENSGKWIPAQQHGHTVTYRQQQRFTFSLRR